MALKIIFEVLLWMVDISMFAYFMVLQFLIILGRIIEGEGIGLFIVVTYALLLRPLFTLMRLSAKTKEEVLLQKDRQISDLANYNINRATLCGSSSI